MDSAASTDDLFIDIKTSQENLLLEIIKELCSGGSKLSAKLKGKMSRIIADCDLTRLSSLHKIKSADESTTTLLGFMHQTTGELSFEEQTELNQAIIDKIQNKVPVLTTELENLKRSLNNKKSRKDHIKELKESLDDKLDEMQEQEDEKVELMMEWLNHRLGQMAKFSEHSSEHLTARTRILELKSKILHLQILLNIFTETNQSIKAYGDIHKELKDSVKEMEQKIKHFKDITNSGDTI